MSLSEITSPAAIKLAIEECERLGRDRFLSRALRKGVDRIIREAVVLRAAFLQALLSLNWPSPIYLS